MNAKTPEGSMALRSFQFLYYAIIGIKPTITLHAFTFFR